MYLIVVSAMHFCDSGEILEYEVPIMATDDPVLASDFVNDHNKELGTIAEQMAILNPLTNKSIGQDLLDKLQERLQIDEHMKKGYIYHPYSGPAVQERVYISTNSKFSVREIPKF